MSYRYKLIDTHPKAYKLFGHLFLHRDQWVLSQARVDFGKYKDEVLEEDILPESNAQLVRRELRDQGLKQDGLPPAPPPPPTPEKKPSRKARVEVVEKTPEEPTPEEPIQVEPTQETPEPAPEKTEE